jgi:hypothetical protein
MLGVVRQFRFRVREGRRGFELVEILTEDAEAAMARGETTAD